MLAYELYLANRNSDADVSSSPAAVKKVYATKNSDGSFAVKLEMEDRLILKQKIAKLADEDKLNREQQDRIPISPEEDYLLNEIAREHKFPTRAKTWRWLLANYAKIEWAERVETAVKQKEGAEANLKIILEVK
ncbi:hypothetical protein HY095_04670 [Candidatus Micrarchaeota archaeon]|nr:hypothetical protein [Candidatus Micrarchaeota archaeon]